MTAKTKSRRDDRAGLHSRLLAYTAAPVVALIGPSVAQASQINDFTSVYDPSFWSATGTGSVDTSAAPASITVIGPDGPVGLPPIPNDYREDFTTTVAAAGTWSFHYLYTSTDYGCYDQGGWMWIENGVTMSQSVCNEDLINNIRNPFSGDITIDVLAGDTIGFFVKSVDSFNGAGNLQITNFSAPAVTIQGGVPEPSTLTLFALGAAGLMAYRSRRRTQ